jgi:hypothetical protein
MLGLFFIGLTLSCAAQEMHPKSTGRHLYYGLSGGYGFASVGADPEPVIQVTGSPAAWTMNNKAMSYGMGWNAGAYIGCMFLRNFGAELEVNDQVRSVSKDTYFYYPSVGGGTYTHTLSSSMVRLIPGLRIQLGESRLHPYTRTSLIIGIPVNCYVEDEANNPPGVEAWHEVSQYSGRLAWGFRQSVGISCMVYKNISVFAEVTGILMSWSPYRLTATRFETNGVDQLNTLSTSQKETVYPSNAITYTFNPDGTIHQDPNSPKMLPKSAMTFSSLGLNIGVHVRFGKRFFKESARYDLK